MLLAEAAILKAMRSWLRENLILSAHECDVEFDNEVPAIASDWYYAIVPAGLRLGPRHQSSGGVLDFEISVRVTLYKRLAYARDRRSDLLLDTSFELAERIDKLILQVDFNYSLLAAAAALLTGTTMDGGEYPEPFKSVEPDRALQPIAKDEYSAAQMQSQMGDPILAVRRGVTFSKCRFMKVR